MEDRSSPPATTSYYRPPIGVRHLESVSARNVVPPGGPPKRLAGVGVFFSLHECSSAPSDDAALAAAASGRDSFADVPTRADALYISEVVRDTLNPDWAPLDEALLDATRHLTRERNGNGARGDDDGLSSERDVSRASERDAFGRASRDRSRKASTRSSRHASLHESVLLRVWFIPAPAGDARETRLRGPDDASVSLAFQCGVRLGALVPLPGGTKGQTLVGLSESGGRAPAGAALSAPPNTPLLRTRSGAFPFERVGDGLKRFRSPPSLGDGLGDAAGVGFGAPADPSLGALDDDEDDPLNPHSGWVVPRSKAWPALLTAAEAARRRRDAEAAATEARLFVSGASLADGAFTATAEDDARGDDLRSRANVPARATTRQIRVASEAILDATRRLRVAAATGARLEARVGANVRRASSPSPSRTRASIASMGSHRPETNAAGDSATGDPAARAASAAARLDASRSRRATLIAAIETARAETGALKAATSARASSLRTIQDALRGAEMRLRDADAIVKGPHGFGRLRSAQRRLVTRRWRLVGDLARVFPVTAFGPSVEAPCSDGGAIGSSDERERDRSEDESSPSTTRAPPRSTRTASDASPLSLAVAGVPLDHTGSLARANAPPTGPGGPGFDPAGAAHSLLNDPECAAAALGYVTQATLQLASVLDVPLRYPVAPGASRSYICDLQQVFSADRGTEAPADGAARRERGTESSADFMSAATPSGPRRGASEASPTLWRRVEFPLFAEPHAAESTRFAYAVFLLNKDLEQLLNAHGLLAVGPRHTLQNLERLFAARKKKIGLANDQSVDGSVA